MVVVRRRSSVLVVAMMGAALLSATVSAPARAEPSAAVADDLTPGGTYVAVTPARVLDTRTGVGGVVPGPTTQVELQVTGRAGVPVAGVSAVVLNTTVTAPRAAGNLAVSPHGDDGTSNVNYVAGQDVAQLVTSELADDGTVVLESYAVTHMVADVVGYFTDRTHSDRGVTYRPTDPRRLFDSRLAGSGGRLVGAQPRRITPSGVPTGATAAVVNLTTILPDSRVFVTAWAAGGQPTTSSMNVSPGDIRSNRAIVPLATDGSFTVASSTGHTDLVVDLSGWIAPDGT